MTTPGRRVSPTRLLVRWSGFEVCQEIRETLRQDIPDLCERLLQNRRGRPAAAWLWRCHEQGGRLAPEVWSREFYRTMLPSAGQYLTMTAAAALRVRLLDRHERLLDERWEALLQQLGEPLKLAATRRGNLSGWQVRAANQSREYSRPYHLPSFGTRFHPTEEGWKQAMTRLLLRRCFGHRRAYRLTYPASELLVYQYVENPECLHLRATLNGGRNTLTADVLPVRDYVEEPAFAG